MDVIIIGGGIAGLYTAFQLKLKNPNIKLKVIEASDRLGGRADNIVYENTCIVTGAGIGRKKKDILLQHLLTFFDFPIHTFLSKHNYIGEDLKKSKGVYWFNKLKKEYKKNPVSCTFKEFATLILGEKKYKTFIEIAGFTDYEKEDVYQTLFCYGFEDNLSDFVGFSVPWKKLIMKLENYIGSKNILLNSKVIDVIKNEKSFYVKVNLKSLKCDKVVFATTIETVRKIIKHPIYDLIEGQPFLRLYGKFDKESSKIMEKYVPYMTMVKGPLQKILPMNKENGVYMISYNDNKCTLKLLPHINDLTYLSRLLEKSLELPKNTLTLLSVFPVYWEIGTHYYKPGFKKTDIFIAQRPMKNVFVVGEMVAKNQGWVEGALESVENIIEEI